MQLDINSSYNTAPTQTSAPAHQTKCSVEGPHLVEWKEVGGGSWRQSCDEEEEGIVMRTEAAAAHGGGSGDNGGEWGCTKVLGVGVKEHASLTA